MGVPTRAAGARVREAWAAVADPAWAGRAAPSRWVGGVLFVAVSSAPLRVELQQFHAERLLAALRAALPADPVVSLRFEAVAVVPS
jgi:hypothetical protein